MSQTELSIATAAAQRLKLDGRSVLPLMSFVGNALNNLARQTANDSLKRMYLMTNPSNVMAPVTNTDYNYYADLTPLIATPTPPYPSDTFLAEDITGGSAVPVGENYPTGLAVTITNTVGVVNGLSENVIYYLICVAENTTYRFASTYDNAVAGSYITITTATNGAVTINPLNTPQLMLDYLQYGTIFYTYPTGTCNSATGGGVTATITETYPTGLPVRITNTSGSFTGLSENTTYYIIYISADTYKFATTLANALAGTAIVTSTGTPGTVTVTPWTREIAQWLQSPDQGALTPAIPFSYIYIWLEGMQLYTNAVAGNFLFNVPYVPTLLSLPEILESDLIDMVVQLAISQGYEPATAAQM